MTKVSYVFMNKHNTGAPVEGFDVPGCGRRTVGAGHDSRSCSPKSNYWRYHLISYIFHFPNGNSVKITIYSSVLLFQEAVPTTVMADASLTQGAVWARVNAECLPDCYVSGKLVRPARRCLCGAGRKWPQYAVADTATPDLPALPLPAVVYVVRGAQPSASLSDNVNSSMTVILFGHKLNWVYCSKTSVIFFFWRSR